CLKAGGSSGFNALLSGIRFGSGNYGQRGTNSNYWSSAYVNFPAETAGPYRSLTTASSFGYGNVSKVNAYSVRCLKN
ncbi:MAG: hypothetical protein WCK10_02690, partial [Candidatus Staskawiczbacteria bacterium]